MGTTGDFTGFSPSQYCSQKIIFFEKLKMTPFTLFFFAFSLKVSNQLVLGKSVKRRELLSNILRDQTAMATKAAQPRRQGKVQRVTCSCSNKKCLERTCRVSVTFVYLDSAVDVVESNFQDRDFHITCFCSIR